MLRNWKTIAIVLALLLMAEGTARLPGLQCLFDPVDGSVEAARWRYAYLAQVPDVVLMGDSRADIDLSPNAIAAEAARLSSSTPFVVNVGIPGGSMEASALFFSQVVLRREKPKLVVLNVSEVAILDAPWRTNPPLYLRGLSAPTALETWRTPAGRSAVWESLFGLARLQHRLRLTVEGPWIRYWRGTERYDWGGDQFQGQEEAQGLAAQSRLYRDTYFEGFDLSGVQSRYLADLLATARKHEVRLVVLITPVTPELLAAFPTSGDVARFRNVVSGLGGQYGVPVIDCYQLPELSPDMFFDLHHLNAQGTVFFSTWVARNIVVPALRDWDAFRAATVSGPVGMSASSP